MARPRTKDERKKPIQIDLLPETKKKLRYEGTGKGFIYVKHYIESILEEKASKIRIKQ